MLEYILHRIELLQREMLKPAQQEPLIMGMFQWLPAIGSHWTQEERHDWLRAMELTFNLLYGRD